MVDALGIDDFDLVAHGSSAAIAIDFVLGAPERARSLVLVNPVPVEGVFTPLEAIVALEQMRDDNRLLRRAMEGMLPQSAHADPAGFEQYLADAAAMAPAAYSAVAEALGRWNRFSDARRLTLPCLLIWGDDDPFVGREAMTRTLVAIPGAANLEVLRNVGHAPMVEAPLLLAEKIVNFVAEDFDETDAIRRTALE
jgi:branched-chain amino acid transport system permease protein